MINDYEARHEITDPNYATATEAVSNDDVISTLNGLIETCKDGQEGFKQAAEGILNTQLKSKFYEYSQQRSQFTGELQTLVRELGGDPEKSGTIAGAFHRSWIDIKSIVTGKDEGAILNEAERGEDHAKSMYQNALEQKLPANIHSVVQRQFGAIKEAHDQVKKMRDFANQATKSAGNS